MAAFTSLQGEHLDGASLQLVSSDHVTMSLVENGLHREPDRSSAVDRRWPFGDAGGDYIGGDYTDDYNGDVNGYDHDEQEDEDDGWVPDIKQRQRFTPRELSVLESAYENHPLPSPIAKKALAKQLSTETSRIQIWFQNRRAKDKKQKRWCAALLKTTEATITTAGGAFHGSIHGVGLDSSIGYDDTHHIVPVLTTRPSVSPQETQPLATMVNNPWHPTEAGVSAFWNSSTYPIGTDNHDFYDQPLPDATAFEFLSPLPAPEQVPHRTPQLVFTQVRSPPSNAQRRIDSILTHEHVHISSSKNQ